MHDALVFTRTKHRANRLAKFLGDAGVKVERIHGNRSQAQRTEALAGFKSGKYRVLVATDIAARGIDVTALGHVVNFDVPHVAEDYIHRVGRTARAETTGSAFTLVSPEEEGDLRGIEKAIARAAAARDAAGLRLQRAAAAEPRSAAAASAARSAQPSARQARGRRGPGGGGPPLARRSSGAGPAHLAGGHDGPALPGGADRRAEGRRAFRASRRRSAPPRPSGPRIAPDADTIEAIIDAAFWASLRREESYVPKISLALLPPDAARHPLLFERPLPLVARQAGEGGAGGRARRHPPRRLAQRRGVCTSGAPCAPIPALSIVVEVAAPGLLVVKHHRGDESGKFVNVAVLEGDQIKVVDEQRVEPARLSAAADVAARLRFAGVVVEGHRLGQRAGAARGVDARARARRADAGGAGRRRRLAGVDRAADSLRGRAAVRASWPS